MKNTAEVLAVLDEIESYLCAHWECIDKVTLPKKEIESIANYLDSLYLLCLRMERMVREKK